MEQLVLNVSRAIIFLLILSNTELSAQNMSINADGSAPDNSAMLDVTSTTSGFLMPRMTTAQRIAIVSPADGLMVYQTDGSVGVYVYLNSLPAWAAIPTASSLGLSSILAAGKNAGADSILNLGALGIGTVNPSAKIDIVDNTAPFSINITNSTISASDKKGVFSTVTGGGVGDAYGIYGEANAATGDKFGVFGGASGAGGIKYGVYGNASGAGTNWAGYFEGGNVLIENWLGIGIAPTNALTVAGSIEADTAYLDGLSIGSQRTPRSSIEIDSVLMINGNLGGLSLFGSNLYNDGTNIRYLNNGFADAYAIDPGISGIFHWETGAQGAILPNDPASFVRLEDTRVVISGDAPNFEIELKGTVFADSLSINGFYSFPNTTPNTGEILRYNGSEVEWGAAPSGDNLGNHTATTNLQLNGNYLSGDGGNEGIHVAANGNVTIGNNTGFDQFAIWNSTGAATATLLSENTSTVINMLARGNLAAGTNTINAFRSRGAYLSQTSVQAGDNIYTINSQPFINGGSTVSEAFNISIDVANATNLSTRIDFATRVFTGGNQRRLTIRGDGNVGIGTENPNAKLDVVGDGEFLGGLRVTGTTAATVGSSIYLDAAFKDWTITATNSNSGAGVSKLVFRDYSSAADRMTIDATGRVGIGTTNPSSLLEVAGDIEIPAANNYTYSAAKRHYQSYAPTAFNSLLPDSYGYGTNAAADYYGYFRSGGTAFGYATVSVNLPDGATVVELQGWLYDNSATNPVRVTLLRQALGASNVGAMAEVESAAITATTVVQNLTDNTVFNQIIDNENYAYFLFFTGRQNDTETRLYGAKITYTVTEAD